MKVIRTVNYYVNEDSYLHQWQLQVWKWGFIITIFRDHQGWR